MLRITSKGIPELQAWLADVGRGIRTKAMRAAGEYLIGDGTHGLKHYPVYKYISVAESGGWSSEKQRRYVMAMIKEGKIDPGYPHRTGELQRGWELRGWDKSVQWTITNETPYAKWVMGDSDQTVMHGMAGWRTMLTVIASNIRGAIRHAQAAVNEWLRSKR